MSTKSEVDDWTEWLDDNNDKREEIISNINEKNEEKKQEILKNDMDDVADFLNVERNNDLKTEKTINTTMKPEKIIALENTPLNSMKDCEVLGDTLAYRIRNCKAKSVSLEKFLTILLTASENKLENKSLQNIQKKIETILKNREIDKRYKTIGKKKPNNPSNLTKNYAEEMDMLYGDLSYDEDEYDDYNEVEAL